jgi:hypothetical protein
LMVPYGGAKSGAHDSKVKFAGTSELLSQNMLTNSGTDVLVWFEVSLAKILSVRADMSTL